MPKQLTFRFAPPLVLWSVILFAVSFTSSYLASAGGAWILAVIFGLVAGSSHFRLRGILTWGIPYAGGTLLGLWVVFLPDYHAPIRSMLIGCLLYLEAIILSRYYIG